MKTIHLTAIIKIEQRHISHLSKQKDSREFTARTIFIFFLGNNRNLNRISEILEEV